MFCCQKIKKKSGKKQTYWTTELHLWFKVNKWILLFFHHDWDVFCRTSSCCLMGFSVGDLGLSGTEEPGHTCNIFNSWQGLTMGSAMTLNFINLQTDCGLLEIVWPMAPDLTIISSEVHLLLLTDCTAIEQFLKPPLESSVAQTDHSTINYDISSQAPKNKNLH